MRDKNASDRIEGYRRQIVELRSKLRAAQSAIAPEEVKDYEFARADGGVVRLSELFGDKDTLLIIHNMGASCPYCTLWADGFNGVFDHLRNRAAFAVSSPDAPEKQQVFAAARGWRFPMVSCRGTSFAQDMGYWDDGRPTPGVSVFRREGGRLLRVSDTSFSPGDDFCSVWHFFDLLPEGRADWQPRFKY